MVRSMFSGVAGLRAHQTKMDVIGNNIANVNTNGFKTGRVTFKDSFYQTLTGSSASGGSFGGGNASQIGFGSQVNSIDVLHTPGGFAPTGDPSDTMINGNGYYMVGPSEPGGYALDDVAKLQLTRVGIFRFDGNGTLVDPNRNMVYGFQGYSAGDSILNNPDLAGKVLTTSKGSTFTVAADGTIDKATFVPKNGETIDEIRKIVPAEKKPDTITCKFDVTDPDGKTIKAGTELKRGVKYTIVNATAPAVDDGKVFTINDTDQIVPEGTGVTLDVNTIGRVFGATIPEHTQLLMSAVDARRVVPIKIMPKKGETDAMKLDSITFGEDGTISGINDEGKLITVGKLALANVPNPNALEMIQSSYYRAKENTGKVTAHQPGEGTTGAIQSGGLEASNVDLSKEFTEMITTQRGFQANTRIITVSDQMLEELVNLKR